MNATALSRPRGWRITVAIVVSVGVSVASFASAAIATDATADRGRDVYVVSGGALVATGETCVAGPTSLRCHDGDVQVLWIPNIRWMHFPLPDGDFVNATTHGWWMVDGKFATPADGAAAQYARGAISIDELIALASQGSSFGPLSFFGVAWPYFWGVIAVLAVITFAVRRFAITSRVPADQPDSPTVETL